MSTDGLIHIVTEEAVSERWSRAGRLLIRGSFLALVAMVTLQALDALGFLDLGFQDWQPTAFAYVAWAVCLCVGQLLTRGEQGKRLLFVLPSALLVVSLTVIPLLLGIAIAFSDWNLSSRDGPRFAGLGNIQRMLSDPFYWNALTNMVWYVLAIIPELVIAFGLALLLSAQIRARRFFRVAFLLPLMLSPVAVSWMIGKSMLANPFRARVPGWRARWAGMTPRSSPNAPVKVTMKAIDAGSTSRSDDHAPRGSRPSSGGHVAALFYGSTVWQTIRKIIVRT